jgi:hypothetical protein
MLIGNGFLFPDLHPERKKQYQGAVEGGKRCHNEILLLICTIIQKSVCGRLKNDVQVSGLENFSRLIVVPLQGTGLWWVPHPRLKSGVKHS